ncbi:hypothetical protein CHS0354_000784 [Potamilus streckersoni]|uniref:Fructose-bisphosphatase n=1 Tax=Potamilus streckersoni TaxID=2493646 RepID=A0AAE0W885_9BIVA|nr:hypothetical protein CHS0354_000784 [Potamilus streckersoni]
MEEKMKKKVVVGMSGGVDSSVAAVLLKQAGYEVIGITMKTWDYDMAGAPKSNKETGCCSLESINDARNVAVSNDFPHYTIDFRADFGDLVIDYFKKEYLNGKTPNPCVMCNTKVKWEALLERAKRLGADFMATGHYANVRFEDGRYLLSKDALPDLETRVSDGNVLDELGNPIGTHKGYPFYTIGQRKGFTVNSHEPKYVTEIRHQDNVIVVGPEQKLLHVGLLAGQVNWISSPIEGEFKAQAKIRYKDSAEPCTVKSEAGKIRVTFNRPKRAITPGQSVVVYNGDDVILGGIKKLTTMGEFVVEKQKEYPNATGEFSRILSSIRLASKVVHREISKAGIVKDLVGNTSSKNVHGETQKGLDVYANECFMEALEAKGEVCGIASEENRGIVTLDGEFSHKGKYVVVIDPLDGSSNIDVNAPIGTIFSILERKSNIGKRPEVKDFLQRGIKQVAAGYVIYGASAMIVYTTGNGVNGFTLDTSVGVYYLSHPNIQIPKDGTLYSVNEGNYINFPDGVKKYIKYCQEMDEATKRPYSARYIGSLVADFHRNLIKGGVFIYPSTAKDPEGKLRLLYECNPLAFIAEQAGGMASNGTMRIMDIDPISIHQCSPYYVGSENMVKKIESLIKAL